MSDSHGHEPTSEVAPAHDHGHDVSKHVKGYLFIGALLIVFTGITVALSYVNFGSQNANIVVAMVVATFKAGLVAAIFMHLKGEKWLIWKFLLFTVFFASGLFFLTWLHWIDPIFGTNHTHH